MTPAEQLRRNIENCELAHPMFVEHTRVLKQHIDDALAGFAPKINRVPGPSGVGKSSLIATLARAYPQTRVDGRLQAPVLVVEIPQFASAKQLPTCVLHALGLQVVAKMTVGSLFHFMKKQLELAGTRVVIFDEISHLVDEGSRVPPRAVSDWLKTLLDQAQITLILFGIPRLERLFSANEQLRRRSRPARVFLPYDASDAKQMAAYAACVTNYARMFAAAGYPISVPPRVLVQQSYLLTGGLIGVLADFMRELARGVADSAPRALTYADCQMVLDDVSHAGSPHQLAFQGSGVEDTDVPPAAMKQAYVHVLTSNSTSVPVRKKSGDK
ncbi:TniB family NTP-binding protein [Rhodoferax fermentans]|nr:TniB family NTP-binding protein [Rhodoferax fermentans]